MFDSRAFRAPWRMSFVVTVLLLAAGATACGGAKGALGVPSDAAPAAASGPSGADPQQPLAYRACLQEHGADVGAFGGARQRPSGATGFSGPPADGATRATIDPATLQAAQDACKDLQPANGAGGPGGAGARGASGATGALGQQFSAYLSCLTDNGVTAASGATGGRGLGSIDRTAPTFTTANEKCKVLLPDGVDPFAGGAGGRGGPPGSAPATTTTK